MNAFYLELFSTLLASIVVFLNTRQKALTWPLNIIKKILSFLVYYSKGLFIKCTLDILLIGKSCYGWHQWKHKRPNSSQVSTIPPYILITSIPACILSSLALGWLYATYTTCSLPYIDALHAVLVLIAYTLLVHKKLEAWPIWIIANTIYLPVCYHKATYLFMIKYTTYIGMSFYGYYKWRKLYLAQNIPPTT